MAAEHDIVIVMTDQERAAPGYEPAELARWRAEALPGRRWFVEHGVSFQRHYTGSLACVPSRPTIFTGHYPDVHGVTQTDGLGKLPDDSGMRWLRPGSVPTLGNWMQAAGYDTAYVGKWHISHADLLDDDGQPVQTNTDEGDELPDNVERYLLADRLGEFGFPGWIGPEPHGPRLGNAGFRRDPLTAERAVAWLTDRYQRRHAGDSEAMRPFLLVVSFVNPHDIVFFTAWAEADPLSPMGSPPPPIAPSPTDDEDLLSKPAAQRAYRDCYPSAYGWADMVRSRYDDHAERYRQLYYRLHQEVDGAIDRVRRVITDEQEQTGGDVLIVRTADHGELLGAHGGLHQKWYNLYDEAARVPLEIVRLGAHPTPTGSVKSVATSHVDLVPTLLAQAAVDVDKVAGDLRGDFETVGSFPGRDLSGLVDDPESAANSELATRGVYLMTRDNILEGDTSASILARLRGEADDPPPELRIQVPSGVGTCFEAIVAPLESSGATPDSSSPPGDRAAETHLWKLVRTFAAGDERERIDDEWELYDLGADPIEAVNRASDPEVAHVFTALRNHLASLPQLLLGHDHGAQRCPSAR